MEKTHMLIQLFPRNVGPFLSQELQKGRIPSISGTTTVFKFKPNICSISFPIRIVIMSSWSSSFTSRSFNMQ